MGIEKRIGDLIRQQVAEGRQIGLQVCVYHEGRKVVDDVAGQIGPDDTRPVQPDTLFCVFSSTKGVASLALHMLADRGIVDYDAPVAKYWPAFAQNGKENVTVAQAMSHQAGLHRMPTPFSPEHITDWDAGIRRIEEGVPAYEPGTAAGYHAVTFAWVVGGIVHGATGHHIRDFIRDEIARPLGIEDELHVGIPADTPESRLATLEIVPAGEGLGLPEDAELYRAMPRAQWPYFNEMPIRMACLPSGNGHFSARALAKVYAALAGDGSIDGVRLVSPERIQHMNRLVTDVPDVVLGVPLRKGIGFQLGGSNNGIHGPSGPRTTVFGHGGAGGSIGFADPEAKLAVGFAMNKMAFPAPGTGTTLEICDAIRDELGVAS